VHWIPTFELPSSCHKRPGLLTYFIAVVNAAVAWHQLCLKDWINFGTYWKNSLSYFLGLGSVALALVLHVSGLGLGLGLDTSGLVNVPASPIYMLDLNYCRISVQHTSKLTATIFLSASFSHLPDAWQTPSTHGHTRGSIGLLLRIFSWLTNEYD